ncbi:hypothetical protein BJY52DRAFT_1186237 [Lactarius psammicola]|nr:hypothetical protein BJY52DRAFT_1186237 [Lactarius psammicola]
MEAVFQMIDGKERVGIVEWVRRHKPAFRIAVAQGAEAEGEGAGGEEDSDSDFEQERGESEGGSPSPSSSSPAWVSTKATKKVNNEGEAGEDTEGKRHPLSHATTASAIPKMLHAAVDTAVGLVIHVLIGRRSGASGPPAPPPIHDEHIHKHEDDEESEEEDGFKY